MGFEWWEFVGHTINLLSLNPRETRYSLVSLQQSGIAATLWNFWNSQEFLQQSGISVMCLPYNAFEYSMNHLLKLIAIKWLNVSIPFLIFSYSTPKNCFLSISQYMNTFILLVTARRHQVKLSITFSIIRSGNKFSFLLCTLTEIKYCNILQVANSSVLFWNKYFLMSILRINYCYLLGCTMRNL